jgi:eukaryotic-like serine/threonine-protein kinase
MIDVPAGQWAAISKLLDEALDLAADARPGWLARVTAREPQLGGVVKQLLEAHAERETQDLLATLPRLDLPAQPEPPVAGFTAGQQFGPYRLIRQLGVGGMAEVWLAERADAAHRRPLALKLPLVAGRSRAIAQRFARERNILAALSHTHIAALLDAGVDGAQPWLAMEFVDGRPITTYCDEQGLSVAQRLRLFLQVLRAVQYAHAQLVIHRDLKPSNVLIDVEGRVKLLDFGVAKLLEPDGAAHETALTEWGGRAMTPQYASPEQVGGGMLGVASDVYSLGVLLYQLLTGRLPYTLKRNTAAALEEAILAAQIELPSQAAPKGAVSRALRGDVDAIVMKALQAAPPQRYASAEAFAQDIQRQLDSQPVQARPAGSAYRMRKFLIRHRFAFGAGATVAIALVTGLAATLWQADRARAQAARAQAVKGFLVSVLSKNDPQQAQGRDLSARELLDRSAAQIDADFKDQPALRAQLHHTVAGIYVAMGLISSAKPHADRAVQLLEPAGQTASEAHLDALLTQSEVLEESRDYPAARAAAQRMLELAADRHGTPNRWTGRLLSRLSWIAGEEGDLALAESLGEQALAAQRQATGEVSYDYVRISNTLAHVYLGRGEVRKARDVFLQIARTTPKLPSYEITDALTDRSNLARAEYNLGNYAAVEAELSELVPRMAKHMGAGHDRTVKARALHSQALAEIGRYGDAVRLQQTNVDQVRARGDADGEDLAIQQLTLAKLMKLAARYTEGLPFARDGLAFFEKAYPKPTLIRERGRWILGELLLGSGQVGQGISALNLSLKKFDAIEGAAGHSYRADAMLSLALATAREPQDRQAQALAESACRILLGTSSEPTQPALRCNVLRAWVAAVRTPLPERAAALRSFQTARDALLPRLPPTHALRAELAALEAEVMSGDPAQRDTARALRERAEADFRRALGQPLPPVLLVPH